MNTTLSIHPPRWVMAFLALGVAIDQGHVLTGGTWKAFEKPE